MNSRDACLEDFWTYCTVALKMPLHEKPHREMVEFYSDETQTQKMMLVPRECWKTSIGGVAYPLWRSLRAFFLFGNPAYRVLVDSATSALSKLIVRSVGAVCESQHHEDIFGTLIDGKKSMKDGTLSFTFRLAKGAAPMIREPNFTPSGIGAEKTGSHCELLVLDDLVTRLNKRTVEGRAKVYEHFKLMQAIVSNDEKGQRTEQIINGTRYHDGDLYGTIIKQDKELVAEGKPPTFTKMIRDAGTDPTDLFFPGEEGKPGGLPWDLLQKKRATMRGDFFAQYMNDPNKENAPFKREQLHWTPLTQFPPLYKVRLTIDSAIKESNIERGDFCAMFVGGWDKWHRPWILDASLRRDLTPTGFVAEMLRMARRNMVESVVYEDDGSLAGMEILWRQEMRRVGYSVPVAGIKHNPHEGKQSRWVELQGYADRGGIHFNDEIPESLKVEIEDQWTRAPFGTNDDVMDGLFLQTQLLPVGFDDAEPTEIGIRKMGDERTTEELIGDAVKEHGTIFRGSLAARFPNVHSLRKEDPPEVEDEEFDAVLEAML